MSQALPCHPLLHVQTTAQPIESPALRTHDTSSGIRKQEPWPLHSTAGTLPSGTSTCDDPGHGCSVLRSEESDPLAAGPTRHCPKKHLAIPVGPAGAVQVVTLQKLYAWLPRASALALSEMVCSTDRTSSTALNSVSLDKLPTLSVSPASLFSAITLALPAEDTESTYYPSILMTTGEPISSYSDSTVAPS